MSPVLFPTELPANGVDRAMITAALNALRADGPDVDLELGGRGPMVDEWESGRRIPTGEQLEALARMTYLPVGYFYKPADQPPQHRTREAGSNAEWWRTRQLDQHDAHRLAVRLTWLMQTCPPRGKPPLTAAALAAELHVDQADVDEVLRGLPLELSERLLAGICVYFVVRARFFDDPALALNEATAQRITAGQLVLETIANRATVRTCSRGTAGPAPWQRGETPAQTIARLQPEIDSMRAIRSYVAEYHGDLLMPAAAPLTRPPAAENTATTSATSRAHRRWWPRRP